ncbi:hypothetical protein KKC1_15990 [Calderihabitans maritimus]|uniref:Uncharacterized protein n=1 Tax=Calderihabitans maritimus TaxID=1246530 RepID=A0A1Z5HT13_9FIRM|nr:hypothetical protein KKC1_15990 [Calderihabitans maritimus]
MLVYFLKSGYRNWKSLRSGLFFFIAMLIFFSDVKEIPVIYNVFIGWAFSVASIFQASSLGDEAVESSGDLKFLMLSPVAREYLLLGRSLLILFEYATSLALVTVPWWPVNMNSTQIWLTDGLEPIKW